MNNTDAFHLDAEFISKLSELLVGSDLTEMTLENASSSIYLKRSSKGKVEAITSSQGKKATTDYLKKSKDSESISSPTVGKFYLASESLVNPKQVEVGELLASIHIGLLQLPVRSPKKGTVHLNAIKDGQTVEYGTELFYIKELSK